MAQMLVRHSRLCLFADVIWQHYQIQATSSGCLSWLYCWYALTLCLLVMAPHWRERICPWCFLNSFLYLYWIAPWGAHLLYVSSFSGRWFSWTPHYDSLSGLESQVISPRIWIICISMNPFPSPPITMLCQVTQRAQSKIYNIQSLNL